MLVIWDKALKRNNGKAVSYCSAYWKAIQAALLFFTGTEYYFSRNDDYCGIVSDAGNWLFKVMLE